MFYLRFFVKIKLYERQFKFVLLMVFIILNLIFQLNSFAEDQKNIKRTILAVYDQSEYEDGIWTPIHQLAEMPLNHLGLKVKLIDINKKLPPLRKMKEVRAIVTWFFNNAMKDPETYVRWVTRAVAMGIKIIVLGNSGIELDRYNRATDSFIIDSYWKLLGLKSAGYFRTITYNANITFKDTRVVEFERKYGGVFENYEQVKPLNNTVQSHLIVRLGNNSETDSHLIVTSQKGSYAGAGYIFNALKENKQWYINPFEFFRLALNSDEIPKPDTTTILGSRIYYSHIDGDGWRNLTYIKKYKSDKLLSSQVIYKEILKKYSHLPVTVAPIAGDIDPNWYGDKDMISIAQQIFALPNVEIGSHTYSHPLDWAFFESGDIEKEAPFLHLYPRKKNKFKKRFMRLFGLDESAHTYAIDSNKIKKNTKLYNSNYVKPRVYAVKPFSVDLEITGSIEYLNKLSPPDKKVEIVQWSGNTLAFEKAIQLTRENGVRNINGGDSRFDSEFPSYAYVSPLGRSVGNEWQVYSSNSNENTYTDDWTDQFFGFQHLVRTLRNTETPRRIKPINVYYHMYSGEKLSSLNALKKNIEYGEQYDIIPITTSHYAGIVDGFNTIKMILLKKNQWQILNRDRLNTIRFDRAVFKSVDFEQSKGVIGQRHYQGSLYVALDTNVHEPIITIKSIDISDQEPTENQVYTIKSRWLIWQLQRNPGGFEFKTQGYGNGEMVWQVSQFHQCQVSVFKNKKLMETFNSVIDQYRLKMNIKTLAYKPLSIKAQCKENKL